MSTFSLPAGVAQLDRASDFGSEGWGFESSRPRQENTSSRAVLTIFPTSFVPLLEFEEEAHTLLQQIAKDK